MVAGVVKFAHATLVAWCRLYGAEVLRDLLSQCIDAYFRDICKLASGTVRAEMRNYNKAGTIG